MGIYATPDQLRAELELDANALDDAAADKLLRKAEDRVDRLVGPAGVNPDTGRKIDPAGLVDWQATKLADATVALAAALQRNARAFEPIVAQAVSGPDFSRSGMKAGALAADGQAAITDAVALLDAAYLRVTGATARA